jgi:hypothetical protein
MGADGNPAVPPPKKMKAKKKAKEGKKGKAKKG